MIKFWHCLLVVAVAFVVHVLAQPPMPPLPLSVQMRQAPDIIDVRVTNTVETVYEVSYWRAIRVVLDGTNLIRRTNYLRMESSNFVSCVTNTTDARPK